MKRMMLMVTVMVLALASVGYAGAQEPEREGREHPIRDYLEELGATPEEVREAMQAEGATWASVITALGGDPDEAIASLIAQVVERTGRDAAEVEAFLTEKFNTPLEELREQRRERREERRGERPGRAPFGGE
jgi:DNA-directed RNA polymerase sigma subunit (sigma70/sigma32)